MSRDRLLNLNSKDAPALFITQLRKYHFAQVAPTWPDERLGLLYEQWRLFFASETKSAYRSAPGLLDGFFPMESERAIGAQVPDPKEFFHYYRSGLCPSHLRDETNALFQSLKAIAMRLLVFLDDSLSAERLDRLVPNLSQMIQDSSAVVLRIAHYPPVTSEASNLAAPHEDITLLTLLPPATASGLQIQSRNKDWTPVHAQHGAITVLPGEMLALATRNRIQASTHRVVPPHARMHSTGRLSFNFFVNPVGTTMLTQNQTAAEVLATRLREIGYKLTSTTE